jgi:hypothetical protein
MHLLDIGRIDDDLLLVMPLADGSLAAALMGGNLHTSTRLEVLSQVARELFELAEVNSAP